MQFRLTPAVKIILIACFGVFLLQQGIDMAANGAFTGAFGLVPEAVVNRLWVWQILTYAVLHGDVSHLFLNLLMLAFIGSDLESLWGTRRFVQFSLICSIVAGVMYLLLQVLVLGQLGRPMVGASGAIFGMLTAYGILFSERQLLFMMVFPMKAKYFVLVLAAMELMMLIFSPGGGLSAIAHLSGMGAGFVTLWVAARSKARARSGGTAPRKVSSANLKLVVDNKGPEKSGKSSSDKDSGGAGPTWH